MMEREELSIITIPNEKGLFHSFSKDGHHFSDAIAELIDNSIDAYSTQIELKITYKKEKDRKNNLKSIEIKDNGYGINLDTLKKLCKNF